MAARYGIDSTVETTEECKRRKCKERLKEINQELKEIFSGNEQRKV